MQIFVHAYEYTGRLVWSVRAVYDDSGTPEAAQYVAGGDMDAEEYKDAPEMAYGLLCAVLDGWTHDNKRSTRAF